MLQNDALQTSDTLAIVCKPMLQFDRQSVQVRDQLKARVPIIAQPFQDSTTHQKPQPLNYQQLSLHDSQEI